MTLEQSLTHSSATPQPSLRGQIIDVHAHFLPQAYREALAKAGAETLDGGMPIPAWSVEKALEVMDRHGVATAILSVSSPGLNIVPPADEAPLARQINQAAARIMADHPGRFGGFATLPMSDVPACPAEIDHALDVLGLDGFILETNHRGEYPGAVALAPILAALDARAAAVLLHPTSPACMHCIGGGRPAPLIEFPFDTTRAVVDLIYSGAAARYPNIQFILPHAGGTLPFLQQRIANFSMFPGPWTADGINPGKILEALGRFYYDTALSANPAQMAALRTIAPIDRILFGSDWPFSPEPLLGGSIAALETMDGLTDADRRAILRDNPRRFLAR